MIDEHSEIVHDHPVNKLTRRRFVCDVCGESTYFNNVEKLKIYFTRLIFVDEEEGDRWYEEAQCCDMKCVTDFIEKFGNDNRIDDISVSKEDIVREYYSAL